MFKGRKFQDNSSGKIVNVVDENGTWVTLDEGTNIKTNVFLQKYSEYLEVDNFFTNDPVMESLAQQFTQNINLNTVPVMGQDGSNVTFTNPDMNPNQPQPQTNAPAGYFVDDSQMSIEQKKREMLANFSQSYRPPAPVDAIDMSQIGIPPEQRVQPLQRRERPAPPPMPDEPERVVRDASTGQVIQGPRVETYNEPPRPRPQPPQQQETDDIYKLYQQNQDVYSQGPVRPPEQRPVEPPRPIDRPIEEPNPHNNQPSGPSGFQSNPSPSGIREDVSPEEEAFKFFRKFKKVHPVEINVKFNEMIADPNYVRQTAMNFEGDVIKFYTQELMKKIYANPTLLEKQIYDSLKLSIMGEEYVQKEKEREEELKKEREEELRKEMALEWAKKTIGKDVTEVKPPTTEEIEIITPEKIENQNNE